MSLKSTVVRLHKAIAPSPTALKWGAPVVMGALAFLAHKYGRKMAAATLYDWGYKNAANDVYNWSPWAATAAGALTGLVGTQAIYNGPDSLTDTWDHWFYGNNHEKEGSVNDPMTTAAAALEQGWDINDGALGLTPEYHMWMQPSIDAKMLENNVLDTPGFTPGQKDFLRDSLNGARYLSDHPDLISKNDLAIGTQQAIVNRKHVPGMFEIAADVGMRAATGAALAEATATLLGGGGTLHKVLAGTGLAAGLLSSNKAMDALKNVF